MSQDIPAPASGVSDTRQVLSRSSVVVHCGDRPGDLRVKLPRRQRGRLEQASLRVRALVSRVKTR